MTRRAWPVLLPVCLSLLGLSVSRAAGGQQTPPPTTQVAAPAGSRTACLPCCLILISEHQRTGRLYPGPRHHN